MVIKFCKKLYKKKSILIALKDYKELADFNLSETKNYIRVNLKNIDKDVKDIIQDEFCNYVLNIMRIL